MIEYIQTSLLEARASVDRFLSRDENLEDVAEAAEVLVAAFRLGGRAFSCGNGGSLCDAMHFAEELTGRFRRDRPALPATAISDPTHLTCVANDFGYEEVFSRYVQAHGRSGDVLIAISTSGKSPSVVGAARTAQQLGLRVIGLTGCGDSPLEQYCDICIRCPGGAHADRVQEMHIKIIHILLELVERHLFPENYAVVPGTSI